MLVAKTVMQDCFACPSSWSGLLEDGRHWRARYRWGWLRFTVDKDPSKMSVFSADPPEIVELKEVNKDEYSGTMAYDELLEYLKETIDLSKAKAVWLDEYYPIKLYGRMAN